MSILKWLHLSDFHFGKDKYDEQNLCTMIIENLEELVRKSEYLDAIFVTGDIAYNGNGNQYRDFETLLLEIDDLFPDNSKPQIYIVPGNHDVDRTKNPMINGSLYKYKKEKEFSRLLDPTAEGHELRHEILPRFSSFIDTFKNSLCFSVNEMFSEKGYFIDSITNSGVSAGIAGINTSWLAWSDNDKEQITPGVHIVKEAIGALKNYEYRILLGHHPLSWFQSDDCQAITSMLAKENIIYLYGHIHRNEAGQQMAVSGKMYGYLGAGAAFLTRETDSLRHSIQYGELNKDGIKVRPLKWVQAQQAWVPDFPEYFPVSYHVESTDYWFFPFHEGVLSKSMKRPSSLNPKWVFINDDFVKEKGDKEPSREDMLMFFDGKAPEYSFVFSDKVPIRKKVEDYTNEFKLAEKNGKNKCMLITGAGGEGKTTLSLQIIHKLVGQGWIVLHCADPDKDIDIKLSDIEKINGPVLIVVDNASIIVDNIYNLLLAAKEKGKVIHVLFISVLAEWEYSKSSEKQWNAVSDFSSHTLAGIEMDEAREIVGMWSQYGIEGLGTLSECSDLDMAANQLCEEAESPLAKQNRDGALLGAIIKTRYRDEYYKAHVTNILERLRNIPLDIQGTEDTLLEAFVRIALMHKEKIYILGIDILAEIYQCKESDIKRKIIYPLGREAVTSKSGGVIYVRHTALADCAINIVEEKFSHIESEAYFSEMAAAAVRLRTNGKYVFKIENWRYLADHFLNKDMKRLAVHIAEAVYETDKENLQVLSHLLKVYLSKPDPDYEIVYHVLSEWPEEINDGALLDSYASSVKFKGRIELAAYLKAIKVADSCMYLTEVLMVEREVRDCVKVANVFFELSKTYKKDVFLYAARAFAQISMVLSDSNDSIRKRLSGIYQQMPSCAYERDVLEKQITDGINELVKLIDFEKLPDSVPKPERITFDKLLNRI